MVRPLCFGHVVVGAGQEEDVVGHVGERREHLLPVDDPLVTVAGGRGLDGGHVRAGVGLAVAERHADLAGQGAGEEVGLLLLGGHPADRLADDDRQAHAVGRRPGQPELVAQGGHLERVALLAAVLGRPRGREPALSADGPVELLVVLVPVRWARSMVSSSRCSSRKARTSARKASLFGPRRKSISRTSTGPNRASARSAAPRRGSPSRERPCLGPAVVELDVVLEGEAVAAVHVQRHVAGPAGRPGGEEEGHRGERGELLLVVGLGPRRLAGEEAGAVHQGGRIGQVAGDRLERSDRRAELDAGSWRTRPRWPGPPRPGRPAHRSSACATRRAPARRRPGRCPRWRARSGPGPGATGRPGTTIRGWPCRRRRRRRSTTTSSSPSMATTSRATGPKGTSVAVPSTAGRRATVATVVGSAISSSRYRLPGSPDDARARAGHGALDERHRGEEAADLLADELQVEQRRPTSAQLLGHADGGPGHVAEGGPEVRHRSRPARWPARRRAGSGR